MRTIHAVLAGALVAAGVWWWSGHAGYVTESQRRERVAAEQAKAEPALYRWHDAQGVLHITSEPPKGRKYERVELREDVNVVPMSPPAEEGKDKKAAK
jgi:hypothetical protein